MSVGLVDFAVSDSCQRSVWLPYLRGWLQAQGHRVQTLRLGLHAAKALDSAHRVQPADSDRDLLDEFCDGLQDGPLVLSHPLADLWVHWLRTRRPNLRVRALDFPDAPPTHGAWLAEEWGLEPHALTRAVPDFAIERSNDLARGMRPLPHVVLGNECHYRADAGDNPHLEGVPLDPGVIVGGCSFCTYEPAWLGPKPPPEIAARALGAAVETSNWEGFRKRVRLIGSRILHDPEGLLGILDQASLADTDLVLSARVDDILDKQAGLRRLLDGLGDTGCRVLFGVIGVENFSVQELLRFNKGFEPARSLALLLALRGLRQRFADRFDDREAGGLSLILYTPWTRPADLNLNFRIIALLGLEQRCGKLFDSRLRLTPAAPLHALAQRDGLLTDEPTDPLFQRARQAFYPAERHWRFQDPGVAAFARIAARLETDSDLDEDPLYRRVQAWRQAHGLETPMEAALGLLRTLPTGKQECVPEDLLVPPKKGLARPAGLDALLGHDLDRERAWFDQGRQAGKLELDGSTDPAPLEAAVRDAFGWAQTQPNPHGGLDVYYARGPGSAQALHKATEQVYGSTREADLEPALGQIGALLGYPDCCVQAYLRDRLYLVPHQLHNWLLRRYQDPGPIPEAMNPFLVGPTWIPCSCHCQASLELLATTGARPDPSLVGQEILFALPRPWAQGRRADDPASFHFAVVRPGPSDGGQVTYRCLHTVGQGRLLETVAKGDGYRLRQGLLDIRAGSETLATFGLEAGLWDHRRAPEPAFWRPLVGGLVYDRLDRKTRHGGADPDPPGVDPEARTGELLDLVQRRLHHRAGQLAAAGWQLGDVRAGSRHIRILLQAQAGSDRGGAPVCELTVQWLADAQGFLVAGHHLAVSLGESERPEEAEVIASVVLDELERGLAPA